MANDEFDNRLADKQAYEDFVLACTVCGKPKSNNVHQPCDEMCDDDCGCHIYKPPVIGY